MPHEATFPGAARTKPRRVFFSGTTALYKGMGVCYDRDYGTAADPDGTRDTRVELPTTSNNLGFAGVAAKDYAANAAGQWIEIYEPGSVCEVSTVVATTVNATHISCYAGPSGMQGQFATQGFLGRGCARALQTITANTASPTNYATCVFSASLDGTATYTQATGTITKTAAFAGVPATANLQGNEYVIIPAGATAADGTVVATPGRYLITAKTSDDAVVVSGAVAASNIDVAFYCVRGYPTVLAFLYDGVESGLAEWISPDSATAVASMVSGYTHIFGGITIAADSTDTLANGTFIGQTKGWKLNGALTTADYVVTVTTGAGVVDASQASMTLGYSADTLAVLTFDQANEIAHLRWSGVAWQVEAWSATAGLIT